jgi:hypothetical protein
MVNGKPPVGGGGKIFSPPGVQQGTSVRLVNRGLVDTEGMNEFVSPVERPNAPY